MNRRFGWSPCCVGWAVLAGAVWMAASGCREASIEEAVDAQPPVLEADMMDRPQRLLYEELRDQVLRNPDSGDAWGRLGQCLEAVEFNKEARQCYEQAMRLDAASPRWPYLMGGLLLVEEPVKALDHLRRAATLADVIPDAPRLRLAQALIERGHWGEAEEHLSRLTNAVSGHAAAHLALGRMRLSQRRLEEAAVALQPCLTNVYTARPAMLLLSQIRQRQGAEGEAQAWAERLQAMPRPLGWPDPYVKEVLRMKLDRQKLSDRIQELMGQARWEEALENLDRLFRAFPEDSEGLLLLGRVQLLQRQCGEAERSLRRHLEKERGSLNGLVQLAFALICQEQLDRAAEVLHQAVGLKPDFAEGHLNLGMVLLRLNRAGEAEGSFREALRCRPGYADAHAALAEALWRLGRTKEAQAEAGRALALVPDHARAKGILDRTSE